MDLEIGHSNFSIRSETSLAVKPVKYTVVHRDGAKVRKDMALESNLLSTVKLGEEVLVVQINGNTRRRAQICKPVEGWLSLSTSKGDDIATPSKPWIDLVPSLNIYQFFQVMVNNFFNFHDQFGRGKYSSYPPYSQANPFYLQELQIAKNGRHRLKEFNELYSDSEKSLLHFIHKVEGGMRK
eukprot:1345599-Amorphochlora_amoeboformis.AAC.3